MPTTPRLFTLNAPDIAGDAPNITYAILGPDLATLVSATNTGVTAQASGYTAAVAYDLAWPAHGVIRWSHSGVEVAAESFDVPTGAGASAVWSTIVKAADGEASPFPAGSAGSALGGYERFADGIAQAGSSTSITLAADEPDGLYRTVDIIAGTGQGQARSITDFNFATKVATVDRAWIIPPDATSQYVLGFPNTGARLDLAQSLVDGKASTVGGALNGAWATAFGAITKNVITRVLSLFGWSSPTVPLATFLLDDLADPKTRTPQ